MSTRHRITAALRSGMRQGLIGPILERHVNELSGVSRMTMQERRVASKVFAEQVWPITRPKFKQGRLEI